MIRFDSGFSTVLVVCEGCPSRFRRLCGSIAGAELAARFHLDIEHTDPTDRTRVAFLSAARQRSRRR